MSPTDRFMSKVDQSGDCWIWTACIHRKGYGQFRSMGRMRWSHRVAYELFRGEIPDGLGVLHRCDVRNCVNPEHLFLGTHQENMDDMASKGRRVRGERCGSAKLTAAQVDEIRKRYVPGNGRALAREFGMAPSSMSNIVTYRKWRAA